METVLSLLKIDLGITHALRDTFFNALLTTCKAELVRKGIDLDLAAVDDQMLLSDYAAWQYRKRTEDVPLANNLQWRIRNRVARGRSTYGTT